MFCSLGDATKWPCTHHTHPGQWRQSTLPAKNFWSLTFLASLSACPQQCDSIVSFWFWMILETSFCILVELISWYPFVSRNSWYLLVLHARLTSAQKNMAENGPPVWDGLRQRIFPETFHKVVPELLREGRRNAWVPRNQTLQTSWSLSAIQIYTVHKYIANQVFRIPLRKTGF